MVAPFVASLLAIPACSGTSPTSDRQADVYAAVIRVLVPSESEDDPTVHRDVFVGSLDTEAIPLGVQAVVVEELSDFDQVRFVDAPEEAIAEEPLSPVRNEGVYLELGPVPETGSSMTIDVRRYVTDADDERFRLQVKRVGASWTVTTTNASSGDSAGT